MADSTTKVNGPMADDFTLQPGKSKPKGAPSPNLQKKPNKPYKKFSKGK